MTAAPDVRVAVKSAKTSNGPDGGVFDGPIDARKETLLAAIENIGAKSFKYLYDFGDGWTHTVKIAKIFPATPGFDDLFLLKVVGRCPPEDVGGPWGYEECVRQLRTSTMSVTTNL